ncbi:MAG TPA: hypothetical protein VIT45_12620 [Allosphingosinicella sp.]
MIRRAILGVAAVALAAGVASASSTKSKSGDPNKVVCKTEGPTGSRLGKSRACHTVAEWAELRRQARANVEKIQDSRPANLSN